jgi:hypothetical protein
MTASIHIRVCTDQRMDGRPVDTRLATPHTRARPYGARAHEEFSGEPIGGGEVPGVLYTSRAGSWRQKDSEVQL